MKNLCTVLEIKKESQNISDSRTSLEIINPPTLFFNWGVAVRDDVWKWGENTYNLNKIVKTGLSIKVKENPEESILSYEDMLNANPNNKNVDIMHGLIVYLINDGNIYEVSSGQVNNVSLNKTEDYIIFLIPSERLIDDFRIQKIISNSKKLKIKKNPIRESKRIIELYDDFIRGGGSRELFYSRFKNGSKEEYKNVGELKSLIKKLIKENAIKKEDYVHDPQSIAYKRRYLEKYPLKYFIDDFLNIKMQTRTFLEWKCGIEYWKTPPDDLREMYLEKGELTKLVLFKKEIHKDEKKIILENIAQSDD